jgi:S-DNA-T family DNA segregation ATPase FtsK/SpoIIIE
MGAYNPPMSLLNLFKGPKSRRRSRGRGRASRSQGRNESSAAARARSEPSPTYWDSLSPERKLDIVGIVLMVAGILILVGLLSSAPSALTGGLLKLLGQLIGWGVYFLPAGLMLFGLWLILRKIERIPPLSLERLVGSVLFFVWALTLMHSIVAAPEMAVVAARDGAGGGYVGGLFERLLWFGLGPAGLIVALLAWLLLSLTLILDMRVQQMLAWLIPLFARIETFLRKPILPEPSSTLLGPSDGYKPIPQPITAVGAAVLPPGSLADAHLGPRLSAAPIIQWALPQVRDVLDAGTAPTVNEDFIRQRAHLIEETLASFGAPAQVVEISRGPTITQFGVEPLFVETRVGRTRVRVSKIASLSDDLALALAAPRIRIQAPVPGHSYVGIEVPNDEMALVALRDVLESETFQRNKTPLRFALGQDVAGHPITANLELMPHLLIAGTTGSGKSVCVNSILSCFLINNTPNELEVVLIDPKRVELTSYNGIPHLAHGPVVVEIDRVVDVLRWVSGEMDRRYHEFAKVGARNIADFNSRMQLQAGRKLSFLLLVIDELADLMMIAPDQTEKTITRLAQLARATGIHMILATQRPSVDVVTGLIKANFPARIAFAVASGVDSRVILDQPGAERLLGRGDMLFQAPDAAAPARLQGVFVSDPEIQKVVDFWKDQKAQLTPHAPLSSSVGALPENVPLKQKALWEDMESSDDDPLLKDAIDLIRREGRASVSMLQRRMRIGYTRAARLVDVMEDRGIVGPPEANSQVRTVLDYGPTAPPAEE